MSNAVAPDLLPLRKDIPQADMPQDTPAKKLADTFGGKFTHALNHYVIGGVANFMISMGITYLVNPRPETKRAKDAIENGVANLFNGLGQQTRDKVRAGARSGLEVVYMFAAGIITTVIMTPLVTHQEKIAHKINQWRGKDQDVLPDYMQPVKTPHTQEERIEQELRKRVNYKASAGDLWKARIATMAVIWLGDQGNEYLTHKLEAKDLPSMDTSYWRGGFSLSRLLPARITQGIGSFLEGHGAGIDKIRDNAGEQYRRIGKEIVRHANKHGAIPNDGQIAIAESFRLGAKEATYMVPLTIMIDKLTTKFHKQRVQKQQTRALAELQAKGIVPEGCRVQVSSEGKVTMETKNDSVATPSMSVAHTPHDAAPQDPSQSHWSRNKQAAGSHLEYIEKQQEQAAANTVSRL